jgi:hypothetical protein
MSRSGIYIKQLEGYKAFIPTSLPPEPPIFFDPNLTKKLLQANALLGKFDGLAYGLPNADLFITMYSGHILNVP